MHGEIARARRAAKISQKELGNALGRSDMWWSLLEREKIPVNDDLRQRALTAIERLQRFHKAVAAQREKLMADLRLPAITVRSE